MMLKSILTDHLKECKGVLTTKSSLVYRDSYFGNDVLAPNSSSKYADERGAVPVEQWIMSMTIAENPIPIEGEGLTTIEVCGEHYTLRALREIAEEELFGPYAARWPLTKILDIGGAPVTTSFNSTETPPIPVHVHGGYVRDGKVMKPGKSEAYFFPPYSGATTRAAITRIGLKAGVTKEDVMRALSQFGKSDEAYTLLNEFQIVPNSGWTVPEGVLHAPGPYVTFEIQLPQDDYHMGSWRLGEQISEDKLNAQYQSSVLRGLASEEEFVDKVCDWDMTTDQGLQSRYAHQPELISESPSSSRSRIFFDQFYGESWEIQAGKTLTVPAKATPQAGILWGGNGTINGNALSKVGHNEFLAVPGTELTITNMGDAPLIIYTVEPIR